MPGYGCSHVRPGRGLLAGGVGPKGAIPRKSGPFPWHSCGQASEGAIAEARAGVPLPKAALGGDTGHSLFSGL